MSSRGCCPSFERWRASPICRCRESMLRLSTSVTFAAVVSVNRGSPARHVHSYRPGAACRSEPKLPPKRPSSPPWRAATWVAPVNAAAVDGISSGAAGAQPIAPWITTKGTQFVDNATKRPVLLHGVNAMLGGPSTYSHVPEVRGNFVRLVISWDRLEPSPPLNGVHQWNTGDLRLLDLETAWFAKLGINVVIDLHQVGWSRFFTKGGTGVPAWYYARGPFDATKIAQA